MEPGEMKIITLFLFEFLEDPDEPDELESYR
jgi:hypothetical protein